MLRMPRIDLLLICVGCTAFAQQIDVTVVNDLDFDRKEIVSIPVSDITRIIKKKYENIHLTKKGQSTDLQLQWVDYDGDGNPDELLFQAEVPAKGKSEYSLFRDASPSVLTASETKAFSRFVPERTDDYAWENDKVAFRTYGPDAKKRFDQKQPNGTLSSGIDIWLKRTDKPVIDKWYLGYQSDPMFYHKDRGEGYDPYHVGASRGTGGTGFWNGKKLEVPTNFIGYKTIATGDLRTIFELSYAPYGTYGIVETKRISLDLGSNFCRFEVRMNSKANLANCAVGITLHDNKGEVKMDKAKGIFRYFEPIDDAFVGEGIVVDPDSILDAFTQTLENESDQNHLLVLLKTDRKIVYYAGFAWTKSKQVSNVSDWDILLERQSQILANPLRVTLVK